MASSGISLQCGLQDAGDSAMEVGPDTAAGSLHIKDGGTILWQSSTAPSVQLRVKLTRIYGAFRNETPALTRDATPFNTTLQAW